MEIGLLSNMLLKNTVNFKEIRKRFKATTKSLEEKSKRNKDDLKDNKKSDTNPQEVIEKIKSKSTSSVNDWLLRIREIRIFYEKTHISPKYIFYIISTCLTILIINYFSKAFTLLVGVIYPVHCSIRILIKLNIYDNKKRTKFNDDKKKQVNIKRMRNWLEYWIVFFLFYNIETIFSSFLEKIPMYLFYKVVFLGVLFLPWYKGAHYIYRSFLRDAFLIYEGFLYTFSVAVIEKIKEKILTDSPKNDKNYSSEEEESSLNDEDEADIDESESESDKNNKKNVNNFNKPTSRSKNLYDPKKSESMFPKKFTIKKRY